MVCRPTESVKHVCETSAYRMTIRSVLCGDTRSRFYYAVVCAVLCCAVIPVPVPRAGQKKALGNTQGTGNKKPA